MITVGDKIKAKSSQDWAFFLAELKAEIQKIILKEF